MPISLVRSVTDTSMMFMITIAPTTSAIPGTKDRHEKDGPKKSIAQARDRVGRDDAEVVFFAWSKFATNAHQEARLFHRVVEASSFLK